MTDQYLAAFDIGATGIKAAFFTERGELASSASRPNGPHPQPGGDPSWRIWDLEEIWTKAAQCLREARAALPANASIAAVAVSGFGADGAPVGKDGSLLYPVISWHCGRIEPQRMRLLHHPGPERIFDITGYHLYPMNTLLKWMWLEEHEPGLLAKADKWIQVQDLMNWKLSGELGTEATVASTTMAMDIRTRSWSTDMLKIAGLSGDFLCPIPEKVSVIGHVTQQAAELTGLPQGTPVVTGGHDCELGVLGAGVNDPSTFIDITGTWEILIALANSCSPTPQMYNAGLDYECHAVQGQWIVQSLMIAGGAIEWVRHQCYRDIAAETDVYSQMVSDAESIPPGSEGVMVMPSFLPGAGPYFATQMPGVIAGLRTSHSRAHIARATWEGLVAQLARQVKAIEQATGNQAQRLRVLGGGQKNPFWTQLKADCTNRVIEVSENKEPTLLGAAILAGVGAGTYASFEEALSGIAFPVQEIEPNPQRGEIYQQIIQRLAYDYPASLTQLPK